MRDGRDFILETISRTICVALFASFMAVCIHWNVRHMSFTDIFFLVSLGSAAALFFLLCAFAAGAEAMRRHLIGGDVMKRITELKQERDMWRNAWKGVESDELQKFLEARRAIAKAREDAR